MKLYNIFFCLAILTMSFSCKESAKDSNLPATGLTEPTSTYYTEEHRPQFHFSPEEKWMNDPNGMVYYDGEYHLFYQYFPEDIVWGPMHWGHAVSEDMVHWEHLPIGLYPDSLGYIFSGSAVIDWNNTSGFGHPDSYRETPPMIAIFTHHNMAGEKAGKIDYQYQSIAYSNDKGRTWTMYAGNPVLPNPGIKDFRDPKVIWHEESQQWVMVLSAYDKVRIYNSPNLKDWTFTSEFGIPGDKRLWECPDLFPMQVEGTGETKWVLITSIQQQGPNGGTATSYFVGDFDGKTFAGDYKKLYWLDYGKDNYAFVTWSDIPREDGRRLAIGWMSNWQYAQEVPTEKWRSAMTLPRVLTLHKTERDYQVRNLPVAELKSIEGPTTTIAAKKYQGQTILLENSEQLLSKIELSFKPSSDAIAGLRFSNAGGEKFDVLFNAEEQAYFLDRRSVGRLFNEKFPGNHRGEAAYDVDRRKMVVYLDLASVELFADDGRCVMTDIFFAKQPLTKIELIVEKGEMELLEGKVTELKRIWE